jgi:hypothetical protein
LNADVALRAPDRTQIIPRVTSTIALGKRVGFETRLGGTEWNGPAAPLEHRLDTRLHFRSPAPFLDELEGRVWRSPDGRSGRILKFGFYQKLRDADAKLTLPLTFRGQATVEATTAQLGTVGAAAGGSRRLGVETELAGLMSGIAGRKALRVKLERVEGGRPASSSSVAYDHGWTVGDFGRVGVNLEMLRASQAPTDGFAPTLNVSWRATF